MPNWPAVRLMDAVIGVDVHSTIGVPVYPYAGPIFLWHSPKFPMADVFINNMPACSVGAMGYSAHIPQGPPAPPTPTNMAYWKRYLLNFAMGAVLMALTTLANIAIALIAATMPKSKPAEKVIKDITGIDTADSTKMWESIKMGFKAFTNWQTWVKLLMPPIPWPG